MYATQVLWPATHIWVVQSLTLSNELASYRLTRACPYLSWTRLCCKLPNRPIACSPPCSGLLFTSCFPEPNILRHNFRLTIMFVSEEMAQKWIYLDDNSNLSRPSQCEFYCGHKKKEQSSKLLLVPRIGLEPTRR